MCYSLSSAAFTLFVRYAPDAMLQKTDILHSTQSSSKGVTLHAALLAGGGLLAALGASTCCVLPLLLGMIGVGSAWLAVLAPVTLHVELLRVAAIVLLGAGFWLVYARRRPADACACTAATAPRATKVLLWAGAAVLALVLAVGFWGELIV